MPSLYQGKPSENFMQKQDFSVLGYTVAYFFTQKQINCVLQLPKINSIRNLTDSEVSMNVTLPIKLSNQNFFDANITSTRVKVSTKSNGTEIIVSNLQHRPWKIIPKREGLWF